MAIMPLCPLPLVQRLLGGIKEWHLCRDSHHRLSGCDLAVADRIGALDPVAWDEVVAGASVFFGRAYLRALDDTAPEGVSHRFALAWKDRRPVAAMVFQLVDITADRLGGQESCRTGRLIRERLRARVLVAGNLLSWGNHALAVAPGFDSTIAWAALGEAMHRIQRGEDLLGEPHIQVIKDMPQGERPAVFRRLGFRAVATDPDMVLDIDPRWRDLDGYLGSLTAKYRKKGRECLAALRTAGITAEPCADPGIYQADFSRLYGEVHDRAGIRLVRARPGYLSALAGALGDGFRCTRLVRDCATVGFVTTVRDRETAVGYIIGFDNALNEDCPVYFRLLYATIEHALDLGCTRLSLGRTALDPKARLGARPVPLVVWARHRNRALSLLLRPLLGHLPQQQAPLRNPFKEPLPA